MLLKNKFVIGCLVQFYELDIIEDYIRSVRYSLEDIENKENIKVDICLNMNEELEQIDTNKITSHKIVERMDDICAKHNVDFWVNKDRLFTIADYRREFNDKYCDDVDVLMWGESDALIPRQTWEILDHLHTAVKEDTPKYVGFFSTCKMWDDTWKILEHPDFTDKPFTEMDTENWWSLRYNMTLKEMNKINDKVEDLDIRIANGYKFNGCGLVISSDVIKSGINIPRSVFFIHEDTAFLNCMTKMFGNSIPQYVIKNVLLVHNRNHPKKRMYIKGERNDGTMNEKRRSNDWYVKANKMCEHNAYNIFTQSKTYTWKDVFK